MTSKKTIRELNLAIKALERATIALAANERIDVACNQMDVAHTRLLAATTQERREY